jgi:hypothetical protein
LRNKLGIIGEIDAAFFEITADDFVAVAVMIIFVQLACEERKGKEQREQQAGYTCGRTDFHRNHLGTENTNAATIDLYSSIGSPIFCWGF